MMKRDTTTATRSTSAVKAIRQKCLDCSNGSANEVKLCPIESCPLYPFRFGKNPYRQPRALTEEQKEKAAIALREARKNKKAKKEAAQR